MLKVKNTMIDKVYVDMLYDNIIKRKSFHLFRYNKTKVHYKDSYHITDKEISNIYTFFKKIVPLYKDIKVDIKIVDNTYTNCNRGQEYCILFYSEKKDNYLQNIGFIGEQLDLYLVANNIGTLWYGIGKIDDNYYNGLEFVTMMAICKVPSDSFRKDMFKSKRKEVVDIWEGDNYLDIANIVRFAPSSCNTQPWKVRENNNELEIYRYKNPSKRGIMPIKKIVYQNLIDIGIFILFISIVLTKNGYSYSLDLFDDNENNESELTKIAMIRLE